MKLLVKILSIVTYAFGAFSLTFLISFRHIYSWNRFVSWLLFEWVIPPQSLAIIGTAFFVLAIYSVISMLFFIGVSLRFAAGKIGRSIWPKGKIIMRDSTKNLLTILCVSGLGIGLFLGAIYLLAVIAALMLAGSYEG